MSLPYNFSGLELRYISTQDANRYYKDYLMVEMNSGTSWNQLPRTTQPNKMTHKMAGGRGNQTHFLLYLYIKSGRQERYY